MDRLHFKETVAVTQWRLLIDHTRQAELKYTGFNCRRWRIVIIRHDAGRVKDHSAKCLIFRDLVNIERMGAGVNQEEGTSSVPS